MDEYDPLTELDSVLRSIRNIRETLPGDLPPPAELLVVAYEIVAEEMRQIRRAQQALYRRRDGGAP